MKYPFNVVCVREDSEIYWVAKSVCLNGCIGLGVVVDVVGYGCHVGLLTGEFLCEECVSEFACRHLDAHLVMTGVSCRIETPYGEFHSQSGTQFPYESFVAFAFLSSQSEIAMECRYPVTECQEGMEQTHGVAAAAEGNQYLVRGFHQGFSGNESLDLFYEYIGVFCHLNSY